MELTGASRRQNYASFLHLPGAAGIDYRPMAYALTAFSQGARGRPFQVATNVPPAFNFDSYAYKDHDGSVYVTLIDKSYGDKAQPASVLFCLPAGTPFGTWQRLDLAQKDNDIAALTNITLGGAPIDAQRALPHLESSMVLPFMIRSSFRTGICHG